MYKWFVPKGEKAEITIDTEWFCVHPFVTNLEIKENKKSLTYFDKHEVVLTIKNNALQIFRGSSVFTALDKAETFLSGLYPFGSIKISIGGNSIELKPNMEDVEVCVTNKYGGGFTFRNKSATFFKLLLQSKIVDNEVHDLESWEQMSIRDWIVYKLFNIQMSVEDKHWQLNVKRPPFENGYL